MLHCHLRCFGTKTRRKGLARFSSLPAVVCPVTGTAAVYYRTTDAKKTEPVNYCNHVNRSVVVADLQQERQAALTDPAKRKRGKIEIGASAAAEDFGCTACCRGALIQTSASALEYFISHVLLSCSS